MKNMLRHNFARDKIGPVGHLGKDTKAPVVDTTTKMSAKPKLAGKPSDKMIENHAKGTGKNPPNNTGKVMVEDMSLIKSYAK